MITAKEAYEKSKAVREVRWEKVKDSCMKAIDDAVAEATAQGRERARVSVDAVVVEMLCARLKKAGYSVLDVRDVCVVPDGGAQVDPRWQHVVFSWARGCA